jgi:hypothetical protein
MSTTAGPVSTALVHTGGAPAPASAGFSGSSGSSGSSVSSVSDLPSDKVLTHAAKIAMEQDKPILLDYYKETKPGGSAFLGQDKETGEKILVKNREEYTSPVVKMFKAGNDYIIVTENSIYIVSGSIKKKDISSGSM